MGIWGTTAVLSPTHTISKYHHTCVTFTLQFSTKVRWHLHLAASFITIRRRSQSCRSAPRCLRRLRERLRLQLHPRAQDHKADLRRDHLLQGGRAEYHRDRWVARALRARPHHAAGDERAAGRALHGHLEAARRADRQDWLLLLIVIKLAARWRCQRTLVLNCRVNVTHV